VDRDDALTRDEYRPVTLDRSVSRRKYGYVTDNQIRHRLARI
jgi:hypothetical protein